MTDIVIGRCSICGGNVTRPQSWLMVGPPPPPRCDSCGSVARNQHPLVDMVRPEPSVTISEWVCKIDRSEVTK